MSKYYGETVGYNKTGTRSVASRCGHAGIRSSAQSWDGSLIAAALDNKEGETEWSLEYSEDSSLYGETIWSGKLEDLVSLLTAEQDDLR